MSRLLKKYTFLNIAIAVFFMTASIESIAIFEGFSIVKLSSLLVLVGWVFQGLPLLMLDVLKYFILLAIFATMSILWSIDTSNTVTQVFNFLWPSIIVTIAMSSSIKSVDDIKLYLGAFVVGALIATTTAFMFREATLAVAEYAGEERISAFGQDQNTLAYLLSVAVTIVLDFIRTSKYKILKIISVLILLAFIIAILSTGSRTGFIVTSMVLFIFMLSSANIKTWVALGVLIVLLAPVIYDFIPESTWSRFVETEELVSSGNFSDRGYIWSAGIQAFTEENMVFGVGYSNFSSMLNQHFGWQMASHNTYLSYLVDLGFIGLIIFLVIISKMLTTTKQIKKISGDIYIYAYVIPFFMVMFVLETEYKRWLFMLAVMLESYLRLKRNAYYKYVQNDIK